MLSNSTASRTEYAALRKPNARGSAGPTKRVCIGTCKRAKARCMFGIGGARASHVRHCGTRRQIPERPNCTPRYAGAATEPSRAAKANTMLPKSGRLASVSPSRRRPHSQLLAAELGYVTRILDALRNSRRAGTRSERSSDHHSNTKEVHARGAIFIEAIAELSDAQCAQCWRTSRSERQDSCRNNIPTAAQPGRTLRPLILPS
jgi:hypothetical protein